MATDPRSGADRRRHPRYTLLAQVRVKGAHSDLVMSLENISLSGALVDMGSLEVPSWIDVGRDLDIAIAHPETLDLVNVTGRVVRLTKDLSGTRFGVEFVEPDEDATAALEGLVDHARRHAPPGPPPLPPRP